MRVASLAAAVADLVVPRTCVSCGRAGAAMCGGCLAAGPPLRVTGPAIDVVTAGWYAGALREALLAYKERARTSLAAPLGTLLARAVLAAAPGSSCLVPVPSSAAARRQRGGDHLLRLARVAAKESSSVLARPLELIRPVRDSVGLDAHDRRSNALGSMRANPPAPAGPHRAVVVDDIVTSGATLTEAVRALRAAGWQCGTSAVIAATPRRPAEFPHQLPEGC